MAALREAQVLGSGRNRNSQSGASGEMSLFSMVGKPGVEVAGWPGREIHQQLHEVEVRVHVMPAAAAGQGGHDRGGPAATRATHEEEFLRLSTTRFISRSLTLMPTAGLCRARQSA
jgi:hypothetical protein